MLTDSLFTLDNTTDLDSRIDEWLSGDPAELFAIARRWYALIRRCGEDVTETLHDGCPTACIGNAAFAYVNVFKNHVAVGFFTGASLNDPEGILEGSGKRMRHVKVKAGEDVDEKALAKLIGLAYEDVKRKL